RPGVHEPPPGQNRLLPPAQPREHRPRLFAPRRLPQHHIIDHNNRIRRDHNAPPNPPGDSLCLPQSQPDHRRSQRTRFEGFIDPARSDLELPPNPPQKLPPPRRLRREDHFHGRRRNHGTRVGRGGGGPAAIRVVSVTRAPTQWTSSETEMSSRIAAGLPPPRPTRVPASELEPAKSESSEDNPHDAHQIDLEAQPERHGEESKVDGDGRRQANRRPSADEILSPARGEKTAENLAQERAHHEACDDDQEDQPDAALGCHLKTASG